MRQRVFLELGPTQGTAGVLSSSWLTSQTSDQQLWAVPTLTRVGRTRWGLRSRVDPALPSHAPSVALVLSPWYRDGPLPPRALVPQNSSCLLDSL